MKKSLFTLAAIATVMASCTSDDLLVDNNVVNTDTKQTEIGFSTFSNKATRADNSNKDVDTYGLQAHHTDFSVWGFKDVETTNYVFGTSTTVATKVSYVVDQAAVCYTQDECDTENARHLVNDVNGVAPSGTGYITTYETGYTPLTTSSVKTDATYKWEYTPVRFWDKNANKYYFYAAAPNNVSWTLNGGAAADKQAVNYFTLTGFSLADNSLTSTSYSESLKGNGNTDLMIATDKSVIIKGAGADNLAQAVELDFNHILSRLNITVNKNTSLANATVNVTSLKVYGLKSTGNFTENKDLSGTGTTLATGTTERWNNTSGSVDYTANNVEVTSSKKFILQSLIIPQKAGYKAGYRTDGKLESDGTSDISASGAPYLVITYTITTTDTSVTPNVSNTESFTAKYNLASIFNQTAALSFNEGWQNTLNITIGALEIKFNPQTYQWDNQDLNGSASGSDADFGIE